MATEHTHDLSTAPMGAQALLLILAWLLGGGFVSLYLTSLYGVMVSTAMWSLHGLVVALIVALVTGLHR